MPDEGVHRVSSADTRFVLQLVVREALKPVGRDLHRSIQLYLPAHDYNAKRSSCSQSVQQIHQGRLRSVQSLGALALSHDWPQTAIPG